MSKIVYIYSKKILSNSIAEQFELISKELNPDNIIANPSKIAVNQHIAYAIINPIDSLLIDNNSILLGEIFDKNMDWLNSSHNILDGSYAIFRDREDRLELLSDITGSRTIWYYYDDEVFITSSSQRAIIMLLGNFEFNRDVIPWILSTGSLGYGLSWDKRIKQLPADTIMKLDKKNWSLSLESNPIIFKPLNLSRDEHKARLKNSLIDTFKYFDIDLDRWRLPLSGGYDSRGIMSFLAIKYKKQLSKLQSVTWGATSSIKNKNNDAYIAKKVAEHFNVPFKYYTTDLSSEPLEEIINRFLHLGEGRIDHISGYMDGFNIWRELFEDGVDGVIRGDEGFGWVDVSCPLTVRLTVGCALCSDYANLKDSIDIEQKLPKELEQRVNETIYMWRDRLYHQYRLPTILSSLTHLKLGYVEQVNPLLSRKVLNRVRELPDNLRNQKQLFKEIVNDMISTIPIASKNAISSPKNILNTDEFLKLIQSELCSNEAKDILPTELINKVSNNMMKSSHISISKYIKLLIPKGIKTRLKDSVPINVDYKILGFRLFTILKMNKILTKDALFLK